MLDAIKDFFTNYVIISAAVSWIVAQILKGCTGIFKKKKFTIAEFLFGTGGMPSSHSAAVCSMVSATAIYYGFNSFQFGMAGLLSMIVIRDALGVRQEVGKHAVVLNKILKDLESDNPEEAFKEFVGHTPFQVLMGALLGLVIPIGLYFTGWFSLT